MEEEKETKEAVTEAPESDPVLEQIKLATEVLNLYKNLDEEKRKVKRKEELLKKIGKFGHFSTTLVKPLDLDGDEEEEEKEPSKEAANPTKRSVDTFKSKRDLDIAGSRQSPNSNPFRFNRNENEKTENEEDDPFR